MQDRTPSCSLKRSICRSLLLLYEVFYLQLIALLLYPKSKLNPLRWVQRFWISGTMDRFLSLRSSLQRSEWVQNDSNRLFVWTNTVRKPWKEFGSTEILDQSFILLRTMLVSPPNPPTSASKALKPQEESSVSPKLNCYKGILQGCAA